MRLRFWAYRVGAVALLCASPGSAAQAQAHISFVPDAPLPGSLVRLILTDPDGGTRPVIAVEGEMAGEPLHFFEAAPGAWRALGAVPVDAADSVRMRVMLQRTMGSDTIDMAIVVAAPPRQRTRQRLAVADRFTRPLDAATQARIARENERAREVGQRAHGTPAMWTAPFIHPRDSRITGEFGTGRMFNERVTSRHLGVDFSGGVGAPVRAANRGVVALVDTFFLAGNVVYLDHGGGVVTGYFHLKESVVREGQVVERGERIGSVGGTGRVTGPHLHWSARYGALAVNPLDLVSLGRWYGTGQ